jgi:nucleoside-diphosphate-sugar epimerase
MRVLITGGTGFIGSRLALRLMEQGHEVRLLSLIKTPAEATNARCLADGGAELLEGSVAERALHERAVRDVEVVHHIAATMREADVPDTVFWDTNVGATKNLLQASARAGVRRFVYCSTMGVTGAVRGRTVDEREKYHTKDIYGRTKAVAEQWVLDHARCNGTVCTAVRPVDVYGPGDRRLLKLFRMVQNRTFFYLGDGRGQRHMIYIDDLLDGMIAAQTRDEAIGEAFFLAGPSPIPLRELVELVAAELGVPAPRLRLPYRPAWLLSALVEVACKPVHVQPPIYRRRVEFYAHDYSFDTLKAREVLGFEPRVNMKEGIQRTVAAYRREELLS